MFAWDTQICRELLNKGAGFTDRLMNGNCEDAILCNIALIAAVRAIMNEPRPVNGDKPKSAEKEKARNSCQFLAIHFIA